MSLGSSVSLQQLLYIDGPHRGQAPATLSIVKFVEMPQGQYNI